MSNTGILATAYIFIDTSVFESENFTEGRKINKLFDLAAQGHVQILLSQITYEEVIARIGKRLQEAKKYLEQHSREMDKQLRILRNIEGYKERFSFPRLQKKEDVASLKQSFDALLSRGKVTTFETAVDHKAVFDKYFKNEPPFHTESKKHEFPDAFALAMLEEHCRQKDIKCYTLSQDKDILDYTSFYLIAEKDLSILIDKINRHIREKARLEFIARIDAVIKVSTDRFLERLESYIERELKDATRKIDAHELDVETVNFVTVTGLELNNYSIFNLDDRYGQVEFDVSFYFEISYEGTDYSNAVYDRESSMWFGEKAVDDQMEGGMRISVQGVVCHTHADGSLGRGIDIVSINNDQELDLKGYY